MANHVSSQKIWCRVMLILIFVFILTTQIWWFGFWVVFVSSDWDTTKPGLWTWTVDYGLDHGLGFSH